MKNPQTLPKQVAPTDAGPQDIPSAIPDNPSAIPMPADAPKDDPNDPLALHNLRLTQDFLQTGSGKKLLTRIPLMKPNPQTYIRTHSTWHGQFATLELKDERETYLVSARMLPELEGEFRVVTIYTCITRQGVVFAWAIPLPGVDGKDNTYWQTAREGAALAMDRWLKIKSNQFLRGYEFTPPFNKFPDPTWPDLTFEQVMRLVGKDALIDSVDHPVVKQLRGVA
jgi:hypothetical protein